MYFDGAYSYEGSDIGVVIVSTSGEQLKYVVQMCFDRELSTNNTAEYEDMRAGLWATARLGIRQLVVVGERLATGGQTSQQRVRFPPDGGIRG
jgi:ribonuclease HI